MATDKSSIKLLIQGLTLCFAVCVAAPQTYAQSDSKQEYGSSLKVKKFDKSLKVRGYQLSKGVYFGQAKVAGRYGLGLVVDRKSFAWGVNNRGISIVKRF